MFVRIRGSNIRSFQVVESYRDVQGRPRQKVLGSLGCGTLHQQLRETRASLAKCEADPPFAACRMNRRGEAPQFGQAAIDWLRRRASMLERLIQQHGGDATAAQLLSPHSRWHYDFWAERWRQERDELQRKLKRSAQG